MDGIYTVGVLLKYRYNTGAYKIYYDNDYNGRYKLFIVMSLLQTYTDENMTDVFALLHSCTDKNLIDMFDMLGIEYRIVDDRELIEWAFY